VKEHKNKFEKKHPDTIGEDKGDEFTYPAAEDIYTKSTEVDVDPENPDRPISLNEDPGHRNEKGFRNHMDGSDLDVPGSELDDKEEDAGREDEENNYYSLGGDEHDDLEEDRGG
jgi:hypothetical protein